MREKKKNTPFLKKSPGEKSNTPLFLQFSGRTLSHEKYPFTGHFGNTHAVIPTSEWGGGGGGAGPSLHPRDQVSPHCTLLASSSLWIYRRSCSLLSISIHQTRGPLLSQLWPCLLSHCSLQVTRFDDIPKDQLGKKKFHFRFNLIEFGVDFKTLFLLSVVMIIESL